jgi:hypothetical protein
MNAYEKAQAKKDEIKYNALIDKYSMYIEYLDNALKVANQNISSAEKILSDLKSSINMLSNIEKN